jgi:hypothetical protein
MSCWLSDNVRRQLRFSATHKEPMPIPTQIVSNGEYDPQPQTAAQQRVEAKLRELGDYYGGKWGLGRRQFFQTSAGMAAAFLAMNSIYGPLFKVDEAEAADLEFAEAQRRQLANQFIFDVQLHFVSDDFSREGLLELRRYAAENWNPRLQNKPLNFSQLQFENFVKEVYLDSDTTIGLLSGAPSDHKDQWFLSNQQIAEARAMVNEMADSKRLFSHFVIWPGHPGWLDEIDRGIAELQPDSWKGYTVGDPFAESEYPWRLDDEDLIYPAYEKMVKAEIRNVCIHKGLLPQDYLNSFANTWLYADVDDVGPVARDWPELNFIIYHSALKPFTAIPADHLQEFERTGRIDWVSHLAEIPQTFNVSNVYAELGTTFASSAITHPRHGAGILGTLIKGMGVDHVLWGTDSVWYGSPQWQIEALRRMTMPIDLQERFGFPDLGGPDSVTKNMILGQNAAKLYGLVGKSASNSTETFEQDELSKMKRRYQQGAPRRSNQTYGYVAPN